MSRLKILFWGRAHCYSAFRVLNVTQFLGALNDNLFKFLTIYLLIDLQGAEESNFILSMVGILFVLPFLIFSPLAGLLADRFSKQKIIVALKFFEVCILMLSLFAYYYKIAWGCYALVFALTTQSALMTPSKYSIIPEIVRKNLISKANGEMTASIYIAVILGTFLASFITQISNRNFLIGSFCCFLVSIFGFFVSLLIPSTKANSKTRMESIFFGQIVNTFKKCEKSPKLLIAIFGSAYFMFIGGFVQLNIVPFTMEFLSMSEVGGGYLFLLVACGIAVGSQCAGRICKKSIDFGLPCCCLLAISIVLFSISIYSNQLLYVAGIMFILGFLGGLFVVPLESYIQYFSPVEMRGQLVAAENFISFIGVLLAPICLFLFDNIFHASSLVGFMILGVIVLVTFFLFVTLASGSFFHFVSNLFVHPFSNVSYINYPHNQDGRTALVCRKFSWMTLSILLGESLDTHIFYVKSSASRWDAFIRIFSNVDILYLESLEAKQVEERISYPKLSVKPIFIFSDNLVISELQRKSFFEELSREYHYKIRGYTYKYIHTRESFFKPFRVVIFCFALKIRSPGINAAST